MEAPDRSTWRPLPPLIRKTIERSLEDVKRRADATRRDLEFLQTQLDELKSGLASLDEDAAEYQRALDSDPGTVPPAPTPLP
jgi:hypothetical protein